MLRVVAAGLLVASLSAACGGGTGTSGPGSAPPTAVPSGTTPPAPGVTRYPGELSLAFPTYGSDIAPILEAAVEPQDYIDRSVADGDPALEQRVGWSHVFSTATNVDESSGAPYPALSIQGVTTQECPSSGLLTYNIEHWLFTPEAQQVDPAGAILTAMSEIGSAPTCAGSVATSFRRGLAPDGVFNGTSDGANLCNFAPTSTSAFYNEVATGIAQGLPIGGTTWTSADFANIDVYDIQIQILMNTSPSNLCYGTPLNWLTGIQQVMQIARQGNPNIQIWAQVSLRDQTWETIVQAVELAQASSLHPDVYYIAYPRPPLPNETPPPICPTPDPTPPPHTSTTCTYQTPAYLQSELYYLGRATPSPSPGGS